MLESEGSLSEVGPPGDFTTQISILDMQRTCVCVHVEHVVVKHCSKKLDLRVLTNWLSRVLWLSDRISTAVPTCP